VVIEPSQPVHPVAASALYRQHDGRYVVGLEDFDIQPGPDLTSDPSIADWGRSRLVDSTSYSATTW
jgi:hypothetical protein